MLGTRLLVKFINDLGNTLLLDDTEYSIVDYSGLEASEYDLETAENAGADGEREKRTQVLSREIMLDFERRVYTKHTAARESLIRFFRPHGSGTLYITYGSVTRKIGYKVTSFRITSKSSNQKIRVLVYLRGLDPALLSEKYQYQIATLSGGWQWKFQLPFRLKQYGIAERIISNNGHLETPVEIFFRGPAINPKIILADTGEYIRVEHSLTNADTLYINTAFRQKQVKLITGDLETDAWDYLDVDSDFFWLQPGDNTVRYEVEDGRPLGVSMTYQERFLGI